MKRLIVPPLKIVGTNDLDTALELEGARFTVDCCNWPSEFPYAPFCDGRIARTQDLLVVDFRVSGLDLRVQNLEDGGSVWEDSCCEIFLQRPDSPEYFNFELNAGGTLLAARGTGRADREKLPAEDLGRVLRRAMFDGLQDYAGGLWQWRTIMMIPLDILGVDYNNLPATLRGNIYKCGDKTAHPHYLSWNPIDTPSPDFHRPEFFGELVLE